MLLAIAVALSVVGVQGPPRVDPLPEGTVVRRDLAYVSGGHERQRLDLYLPAKSVRPALVVLIHGGAFMMGDKSGENAAPWLEVGFAVAAVNYRLSHQATFPAAIEDVKSAVRWLRHEAGAQGYDAARIGVFGASAGGNLAALVGTSGTSTAFRAGAFPDVSSRVQAVVVWFGPTDFLQMDAQRLPDGQEHNPANSPESRYLGGPIQERQELAKQANPITYVTSEAPPFLIAHGDRDRNVPYGQSLLLVEALKRAGVQVDFMPMPGEGHGFRSGRPLEASIAFLRRHLQSIK